MRWATTPVTDEAIRNFDLARRWYKEYEEKAEVRGD